MFCLHRKLNSLPHTRKPAGSAMLICDGSVCRRDEQNCWWLDVGERSLLDDHSKHTSTEMGQNDVLAFTNQLCDVFELFLSSPGTSPSQLFLSEHLYFRAGVQWCVKGAMGSCCSCPDKEIIPDNHHNKFKVSDGAVWRCLSVTQVLQWTESKTSFIYII